MPEAEHRPPAPQCEGDFELMLGKHLQLSPSAGRYNLWQILNFNHVPGVEYPTCRIQNTMALGDRRAGTFSAGDRESVSPLRSLRSTVGQLLPRLQTKLSVPPHNMRRAAGFSSHSGPSEHAVTLGHES